MDIPKTFVNMQESMVEFEDVTQYDSAYSNMLKRKLKRIDSKLHQTMQINSFMKKIITICVIAIACMTIIITTQNKRLDETYASMQENIEQFNALQAQYDILYVNYELLQNQYLQLEESLIVDDDTANISETKLEGFTYNEVIPLSSDIQQYAYKKCNEIGIDYSVFLAVMWKESRFLPDQISASNDYGLCQINITNHKWIRNTLGSDWNPLDPYDSIDAGILVFDTLLNSYNITTYNALLMSYNMGYGGASKCFSNGVYSSNYSRDIMAKAPEYGYTGNGII